MTFRKAILGIAIILLLCSMVHAYDFRYSSEILLDTEVGAIAVNPATDTVAVISKGASSLDVIDIISGAINHKVLLPSEPSVLAINNATNLAIVASTDGTIWVVDLESGELVESLEIGEQVYAIAVNEEVNTAVLGVKGGLKLVDLASGKVARTVGLSGDAVSVCLGRLHCAVASRDGEGVIIRSVDLAAGSANKELALSGEIASLSIDEELGYGLFTKVGYPGLMIFNLATFETMGMIPTEGPVEIIAVNPSTHMAFLSNSSDGTLSVVDLDKKRLLETVNVFEQLGPVTVDASRNLALVGHGKSLAILQLSNPLPVLTSMAPEQTKAGEEGVSLSLSGSKFIKDTLEWR